MKKKRTTRNLEEKQNNFREKRNGVGFPMRAHYYASLKRVRIFLLLKE